MMWGNWLTVYLRMVQTSLCAGLVFVSACFCPVTVAPAEVRLWPWKVSLRSVR